METLTLVNGNKKEYQLDLPEIYILSKYINDVALAHIKENTGLELEQTHWGYKAQPKDSSQIVRLLMTYNYKTQYYNNLTHKNVIMLKSDHHVAFDIDDICYDCAVRNRVACHGLEPGDLLAC